MKNIFYVLLTLLAFGYKSHAQVEFDLRKGVDLTTTNNVTLALLNQLVDAGTISATNKGAVIRRSSGGGAWWPDVSSNPRYTNFLWLDLNTAPGTLKQYVPSGNVYSNWVVSTVTPGSVGTVEIVDYAVTGIKLATNSVENWHLVASSVSGNKIADNGIIAGKIVPSGVIRGNYAAGSITGGDITNKTITATNIADNTIGPGQLAADAIGTLSLTNGAVTTDKIAPTNITRNLIRDDAIGTLQITNAAVTTNKLAGEINAGLLHTNVSHVLPVMWGSVSSGGTIYRGHGGFTIVNGNTGRYRLDFATPFSHTNYCIMGGGFAINNAVTIFNTMSNTTSSVWVQLQDATSTFKNSDWYFTIYNY